MSKLKPKSVSVTFGYNCPTCDALYKFDYEEVRIAGVGFCCFNAMHHLAEINKCKVTPQFATSQSPGQAKPLSRQKVVHSDDISSPAIVKALKFFKKMGYSVSEVRSPLLKAYAENRDVNRTELIQKTLKRIEL